MSERLTPQLVERVARLARLKLAPDEVERFTGQLQQVLKYVAQLDAVDSRDVEPLAHPLELTNVLRADEPAPGLSREAALANAPRTDGRYFLVPPILDEK
ncbi:MAG: Asp-tRNA(Asn)/Glu-tRNA(Gln) amidotransferase subunit GatC [Planctomyces sp.]|nr:Asp-tRNA(Asn)/Glu-tRNA(Gln) amidotransferase subunit GatC [Planctomyces sp.]